MESSIKARKSCGKEALKSIEEVSTKYYSNTVKIIILAFITVMACTELQIVNDLQQQDKEIQSLSNFSLKSRNSGYAFVYRDKANLKKPTLLRLTQFGFGMGPEFSSDIAGDGPRKKNLAEDEYDPELEKIKKKKSK